MMPIDPLAVASDIAAALPNAFPFPIDRIPTWALVNADSPLEVPLMGQFDPLVKRSHGDPIWVKRPGLMGGQPWLKYVGRGNETLKFTFHAISNSIIDVYPSAAWNKLQELAQIDITLGRPPKLYFVYGATIVQGFITSLPEGPFDFWLNTRLPREIGPVEVELTLVMTNPIIASISTNYVILTEGTTYEQLARTQFNDALYGPSLAEYNQGKRLGDIVEIPRKNHPAMRKRVSVSPFMRLDDDIEGL